MVRSYAEKSITSVSTEAIKLAVSRARGGPDEGAYAGRTRRNTRSVEGDP
jgi:hypothetical protein